MFFAHVLFKLTVMITLFSLAAAEAWADLLNVRYVTCRLIGLISLFVTIPRLVHPFIPLLHYCCKSPRYRTVSTGLKCWLHSLLKT